MKRSILNFCILIGLFLSITFVSSVLASKDEIIFEAPNGKVTFTHKNHQEKFKIDCLKCHHTWKKDESSGKLCRQCHKAQKEDNMPSIKDAMHKKCRDCHSELKKANKPGGPTLCTQCHVKAK